MYMHHFNKSFKYNGINKSANFNMNTFVTAGWQYDKARYLLFTEIVDFMSENGKYHLLCLSLLFFWLLG